MRVVAGALGGRVLRAPKGSDTRPTSDRVREALFSILGSVDGSRVLDLFAGSGALGIEALSRGAGEATFVDAAAAAVAAVRHNLEQLGLQSEVLRMPALRALACTPVAGRQYDLVFLDPPYRMASSLGPQLSTALPPILAHGARVVAESDRRAPLDLDLALLRERQYGDTLIRIHVAG
ncbi:MAG TPA: 16S rRNA (guanine(966)-N(2))-methyltransferase RsmD [Solirubrobacteraceae bacterium]|nr:16S rRNA (guanine(966)-N(2))-methyltransferase RsmD [Solirubrobacteraceae bacterium]